MCTKKKKFEEKELETKNEKKEIPENQLDEIAGGAFDSISRIPPKKIDDSLKEKV